MRPLIDGDILVYQAAFGGEGIDEETGEKEVFSFDYVAALIDKAVADICLAVGATEEPTIYLTGDANFRNDIAVTKPYKGNRSKPKPYHYKNARAYLLGLPNTVLCEGIEADDAMSIEQMSSLREHGVRLYLQNGTYTILDYKDYMVLKDYTWFTNSKGYVVREEGSSRKPSERKIFYLHREVLGNPEDKIVDHITGDVLDNRKVNLRVCSIKENIRNSKSQEGSSKYKGVSWSTERNRWQAGIKVDRKRISLGRFLKEEDAARAYDEAALKYFGEFARLNLSNNHEVPSFKESIISTRDKDLRMVLGNHHGWEFAGQPEFFPQWVGELGTLSYDTKKNKISGTGLLFFYSQLITGDTVDNIPGLPKKGPKAAWVALEGKDNAEEAFEAVVELYKGTVGEEWDKYMLEQGQLLWMVREVDEEGNPVMWEIPK